MAGRQARHAYEAIPRILPVQRERFLEYLPSHTQGVAGIMLASSLNAVCYNMVSHAATVTAPPGQLSYMSEQAQEQLHLLDASACPAAFRALQTHSTLIKRTSAVTTTVLGEIKIVGLLVLSAILLGKLESGQLLAVPQDLH